MMILVLMKMIVKSRMKKVTKVTIKVMNNNKTLLMDLTLLNIMCKL